MSYSWVPFYRELAERLLTCEDKQDELLTVLREMEAQGLPTVPLDDNQPGGGKKLLEVMDPFTFLATFSRVGPSKATKLCAWIKKKWDLQTDVPTDFDGRANILPVGGASWFFASFDRGRQQGDVPLLWQLAQHVFGTPPLAGEEFAVEEAQLLEKCLKIGNVGLTKLAAGLFWLNPQRFLPISGPIIPFLEQRDVTFNEKALERGELNEYRAVLKAGRLANADYVALNDEAYQWNKSRPTKAMPLLQPTVEIPRNESLPLFPLNHILYGPPGTGKTFNAIPRAVAIIDGVAPDDRDECQQRFDELRREKRIGFVTFHQSFSYEEFIEGLRPKLNDVEEGAMSYEVRDGILKSMALQAIGSALQPKSDGRVTFEGVWNRLLDRIENEPTWELAGLDPTRTKFQLSVGERGNIYGHNVIGDKHYQASRAYIQKTWESLEKSVRPSDKKIRAVIGVGAATNLIGAVVEELRRLESTAQPTLPEALDQEAAQAAAQAFLDGSPSYLFAPQSAPRFVLIVDEINRGNISRILGELITLLEDDKRLGKTNELRVTLPVSQETFALPPNLYILGTMNTADKSLALLDIALRRRFSFQEIRPNFSHAPLTDEMQVVLNTLNERLEFALDREHCLGHAYFMEATTPEKFNEVFHAKIIPLLQEFFYNDWDTLRAVLGEAEGKAGQGLIRGLEPPKGMKGRTRWRWWFDVEPEAEMNYLGILSSNYGHSSLIPTVAAQGGSL